MDRALYIWGCARTGCQHQDGRYAYLLGKGYSCMPHIAFDDLSRCYLILSVNLADALAD